MMGKVARRREKNPQLHPCKAAAAKGAFEGKTEKLPEQASRCPGRPLRRGKTRPRTSKPLAIDRPKIEWQK